MFYTKNTKCSSSLNYLHIIHTYIVYIDYKGFGGDLSPLYPLNYAHGEITKKYQIINQFSNTNILACGNKFLNLVIKMGEHVAPPVIAIFKLLSCSSGESFSKTDIISKCIVGVAK